MICLFFHIPARQDLYTSARGQALGVLWPQGLQLNVEAMGKARARLRGTMGTDKQHAHFRNEWGPGSGHVGHRRSSEGWGLRRQHFADLWSRAREGLAVMMAGKEAKVGELGSSGLRMKADEKR